MPALLVPAARALHAALLCLGLSSLPGVAVAAGDSSAVKRAAPTPSEPADEAGKGQSKPAATRASGKTARLADARVGARAQAAPGASPVAQDPIDKLRELLAERLGATKASQGSANVLRVAAQSRAEVHAAPAARRPAQRAVALDPAKLAAAHRQAKAATLGTPGNSTTALHWAYHGDGGPDHWARLKPEFATCASGQRQSPIDIRDGIKLQLEPVLFDYKPSSFAVIDNGHTVQVNLQAGNAIEVMGRRFELEQFHFHRPSEERINGRLFDMVAHLVHKSADGRSAVVAVLLERGSAHPIVQSVWNNLPLERGEELRARPLLDLNALLPAERGYYTYMGSLTTPPCSEAVLWMVMKNPVQISNEQIAIFSRLYPMNARPIQSAAGRMIKESN